MSVSQPGSTNKRRRGCRYWVNLLLAGLFFSILVYFLFALFTGINSVREWMNPVRAALCCTPADAGLAYEAVSFPTEDGLTLKGWYLPSENRAAVLLAHGLGGTRESVFGVAQMLVAQGYGVLSFDLRTHGESDGEQLSMVWRDGLAAVDFLKTRPDVDDDKIGAWGFSLGGIVVTQAAALSEDIRAVAVDGAGAAGYEDLPSRQNFTEWLYLPYDFGFYLALSGQQPPFALVSTLEAVRRISPRPMLFISAAGERIGLSVEQRSTKLLYDAASDPRELWQVEGGSHGGAFALYPEMYAERLGAFFSLALLNDAGSASTTSGS